MRYAVISDIHANLEAFEAVLEEIGRIGVDRIVSLGDLVGYNANPNECVQILREKKIPTVMGNHDAAGCGQGDAVDFNPIARAAILWTKEELKPDHRDFLNQQPEQRNLGEKARLVHGSLMHRDHYLLSRFDMTENIHRMRLEKPEIRILFFGHTHYQVAVTCDQDNNLSLISTQRFTIRDDCLYLINPGSVGQPRDQDPRSAFLIYDEDTCIVEFIRISYNVRACAKKILSAGLPHELADRLSQGW